LNPHQIKPKNVRTFSKHQSMLPKGDHTHGSKETHGRVEKRIPHHEIFKRLEELLLTNRLAIDVNALCNPEKVRTGEAHTLLANASYLKVTGWVAFQDFKHVQARLKRFRSIALFSAQGILQQMPQMVEVQKAVRTAEQQLQFVKDKNQKAKLARNVAEFKEKEQEILQEAISASGLGALPDWMIEAFGEMAETYIGDRVRCSVYPFENHLSFNIAGNLRRECFVGSEVEDVLSAYGMRPNLQLSVFGIITALPLAKDCRPNLFSPAPTTNASEQQASNTVQAQDMEQGLLPVLGAMEAAEAFIRPLRYPAIAIYPIAVYRDIHEP
jgi:hypothetical protein